MRIVLNGLEKSFLDPSGNRRRVISAISADIAPGALVAVTGPSGAGKTTFFNLVSGLFLPDSGTITADKTELTALSERERDRWRAKEVGYIFQTFNLLSDLSIIDNVVLPHILIGNGAKGDLEKRAEESLTALGIGDHLRKYPHQLSVGQRQRVAVARALLVSPRIIIADEPTANLDDASARIVADAILTLRGRSTVFLASHDGRFNAVKPDHTIALGGEVSPCVR
ncbi:MAG TPA: ATP-binding cassette domain-containing protein [bacterium]|nr:ATP-binding cassette domain-containing protein [bacterium]